MNQLPDKQKLIEDIKLMQGVRKRLRQEERFLKDQEHAVSKAMPVLGRKDIASNLSRILPSHLVPTNTGSLKSILQPYFQEITFELGPDLVLTPNFHEEKSFQVTQEAAFLLTGISRAWRDGGPAGHGLPLELNIKDNQSTRQFNDNPIPLQHIGSKSNPTQFPVPLLLLPNASVSITLKSWIEQNMTFTGDNYVELAFMGYRIPIEDTDYLLDELFS